MRRPTITTVLALAVLALGSAAFALPTGTGAALPADCTTAHGTEDTTVVSRADDRVTIAITVFQPGCATASSPAPVMLHSHGWSGSRTTDASSFQTELDAGVGVVSIDQRGHGASDGEANVQDPDLEAQDIMAVIDHVASLGWVALDVDGEGTPIAGDPVLFAAGGSYGGGYQTVTALTEIAETGETRFDALAPEITWFDLPRSLAPNGVPRSAWNTVLYAGGMAQARPAPFLTEAFGYASTTGQWPDGTVLGQDDPLDIVPDIDARLHGHGPVAFVEQGIHLDLPVIWRQGINDTLFNLNEGLDNFTTTLTDGARARSIFVGYNGGHVLPTAYPSLRGDGPGESADHCSGALAPDGWGELRLAFFEAVVDGDPDPSRVLMEAYDGLARFNLMTDRGDGCVRLASLPEPTEVAAGVGGVAVDDAWLTSTGAGVATHLELAVGGGGATTFAGVPTVSGTVTSAGVDQRILFAISRGTSPADATVIQSNLTPFRVVSPVVGQPFELDLAGFAVELAPGERLFLTLTPISEQFYAHGSARTPGGMAFTDLEVGLPAVAP